MKHKRFRELSDRIRPKALKNSSIAVFILLFMGVGVAVHAGLHAATPTASIEAESGTVSAAASNASDTTASGTHAVKFGSGSSGSGGTVTHGQQITLANTGYLAYVGPQGQTCTDANLTVYNTRPSASSLGSSVYCAWFKQGINIDAPITITASKYNGEVYTNNKHVALNWVTVYADTPQDYAIGPENYDVYRSQLTGSSDGARFENANIIETYISVALQSSADHNDGVQAYMAGSAGSILRCNVQAKPVNAGSTGIIGSSGVFFADSSAGTLEFRDNYIEGGVISMRFNENMFYRITGNIVKTDPSGSPLTTDNARSGAFLEWSNNKTTTGASLNP